MTPEERQRARDRAADGIASREEVRVPPQAQHAFTPSKFGLSPTERRRLYRAAAKKRASAA